MENSEGKEADADDSVVSHLDVRSNEGQEDSLSISDLLNDEEIESILEEKSGQSHSCEDLTKGIER